MLLRLLVFGDLGVRCFVRRFMLGLDEFAVFVWKIDEGMPSRAARNYKNCRDKPRSRRRWRLEVIRN